MYGVSTELPLHHFVGQTLECITICPYQISFNFSTGRDTICAMGSWELHDENNDLIDKEIAIDQLKIADRDSYRIHKVVGQDVTAYDIDSPLSFTLRFANGYSLRIFDDSPQYEFISITIGDDRIII